MSRRLVGVVRVCGLILRLVLLTGLMVWVAAAPLAWILRDGLGPGMVETTERQAAFKFVGLWGIPALVLAVAALGLWLLERCLTGRATESDQTERDERVMLPS
jgi:hypothetical protein